MRTNGTNLPTASRSAREIEAYAKAARQRELDEEKAERAQQKAQDRAAVDERRRASNEQKAKDRDDAQARRDARAANKAATLAAEISHEAEMATATASMVLSENLWFVAVLNRYLQKVDNEWLFIQAEALRKMYPLFQEPGFEKSFVQSMSYEGRNFTKCTYSAQPVGKETLNLLDRSEWVQPIEGEPHWLFEVLMQSLGCNKQENIQHLEHVIYYHWAYPEYYLLPAIVIHGEGGTGKNLLVDKILYTMYPRQTLSATSENIVGNFNGLLVGVMAALINENMAERGDMNTLKDMLHKPRLLVNIKNVPQFQADNIALYFIGVNFDSNGGVQLDRSDADRRISVLFCEHDRTLKYWIAKRHGWTLDQAEEWMTSEGDGIASDPVEVAKWLYRLQQTYQHLPAPKALHGADFVQLMEDQKRIDERIYEAVFSDPNFTRIERRTLYRGYRAICRDESQRYAFGKKQFYRRAELWLKQHLPLIALHNLPAMREGKDTMLYVWADRRVDKAKLVIDNSTDYVTSGSEINCSWQGPELV